MKLTPATVRTLALLPGKAEYTFFDNDVAGFGVRLRASGSKRYVMQYAIAGRTRRIVLGAVTALDLSVARATAKDLLARVRLGDDPLAEKIEGRAAAAETVGRVLPAFLTRQRARLRPRSFVEVARHLEKHAAPLHARSIAAVDRRSVALLLNEITAKSGPTAARHLRQSLNAFFWWCVGEGMLEHSPVTHTNVPIVKPARTRVLSRDELRTIWHALGDDRYSTILKLLLLTGLRRSEIANLQWGSEIDLGAGVIKLPAGRVKNAREHVVPLSKQVIAILAARPRTGEMVFGGFQNWDGAKQNLDGRIVAMTGAPIPDWTPHDFRRCISTWAHEAGVSHLVVEAILGHASGQSTVARVYNQAQYVEERRRVLQRWADHVLAEKPAKVVALPRRGGLR
jgi:integrase